MADFLELLRDRENFLLHHLGELKTLVTEGDSFLLHVEVYYSFFKNRSQCYYIYFREYYAGSIRNYSKLITSRDERPKFCCASGLSKSASVNLPQFYVYKMGTIVFECFTGFYIF